MIDLLLVSLLAAPGLGLHVQTDGPPVKDAEKFESKLGEHYDIRPSGETGEMLKLAGSRCPYYDDGERFSCGWYEDKKDPDVPEVKTSLVTGLKDHLKKKNATLYFIGDAVSGQYFDEFSCAMFLQATEIRDAKAPVKSSTGGCRDFDGSKLCYISAGTFFNDDATVRDTINQLALTLKPGDVVVANQGIWGRRGGKGNIEREYGFADLEVGRQQDQGIKFFWRETLAQQYPTRDGTSGDKWFSEAGDCAPIQATSGLELLNEEIDGLLKERNVSIIPGFKYSTVSDPNDHLSNHTPHEFPNGFDCTHWCTPSKTLRTLAEFAFTAINDWIRSI